MFKPKNKLGTRARLALLALLLLAVLLFALRFGSAHISWRALFPALLGRDGYERYTIILYTLRLPRVLAGCLAGVGLSVSGVLLQSITDNALAGPNVIGVNAGAGVAILLWLALFPRAFALLPFVAFAGALLATLMILLLSERVGASRYSVILAGVAMTTLLGAVISAVTLLDSDLLSHYSAFSVGGFVGVGMRDLPFSAAIITAALVCALLCSRALDALCLGDASAACLGVRVRRIRLIAVVCASASAAAAVSFAGLLGFVGLIVPHAARRLVGYRTATLLPAAALLGAALTVLADLLGRCLAAPSEIPVGITLSFIGVPAFLFLLLRRHHGAA